MKLLLLFLKKYPLNIHVLYFTFVKAVSIELAMTSASQKAELHRICFESSY